jgi:hypothetical protein
MSYSTSVCEPASAAIIWKEIRSEGARITRAPELN